MKEWIQGCHIKGKVKEAVEGTKSLLLLAEGIGSILSYQWNGGNTLEIVDSIMDTVFEKETVTFPNAEEAKNYVIEKAENLRGYWDGFSLQVDIPEQVKVDRKLKEEETK